MLCSALVRLINSAVHQYFPNTVSKASEKSIKTAYSGILCSSHFSYNCRKQRIDHIHSASTTPNTTSSRRHDMGNNAFVQSVEGYASQDLFRCWEKRNTSIVPTVLSSSLFEDWHDNAIFPVFWYILSFPGLQTQFVQARGEFHSHNVFRFRQVYHTFQGLYLPLLHWFHRTVPSFQHLHQKYHFLTGWFFFNERCVAFFHQTKI